MTRIIQICHQTKRNWYNGKTVNSNLLIVRKSKATSRKRIPTLELNIATPELEIPMAPEA